VICSSLMPAVNKVTVQKLRQEKNDDKALLKYATIGKMFSGDENKSEDYYTDFLLDLMENWVNRMNIPRLVQSGVTSSDFKKIVNVTDNKNNPATLNQEEMTQILQMSF
jgi:alcohol dehydrogenase class IV